MFLALSLSDAVFIIVGILTFMSMKHLNCMLSWVEHEKSFKNIL